MESSLCAQVCAAFLACAGGVSTDNGSNGSIEGFEQKFKNIINFCTASCLVLLLHL